MEYMIREKSLENKGKRFKIYSMLWNNVAILFLVLLFVGFPLFFRDKYYDIAYYKWIYYVFIIIFLIFTVFLFSVFETLLRVKKAKYLKLDYIIILYGFASLASYISSQSQMAAFMGTDGWYMGMVAQVFFILSYLIFCKRYIKAEIIIALSSIGSFCCCIIGIFQRYGFDFLHLYWEMPAEVVRDYISTIGNRTWFSSYICAVCPVGIYLFWKAKNLKNLLGWGFYIFTIFSCLVTTNSDSVYVSIFAVFFILFILSIGNGRSMLHFCYLLAIWFCSCLIMALLRIPFANQVRELRGISALFLNIKLALIGALFSICLAYLVKKKNQFIDSINRCKCQKLIIIIALSLMCSLILLIILNTSGVLNKCFGVTIHNKYLFFDDSWGDYRGSTWSLTLRMFRELPLINKFFGVGPDCFAFYAYSNQEYTRYLNSIWGEAVLANAHNEWLNSIFCLGLIGGIIYISIFISVVISCLKKEDDNSTHPIIPAIGLCVVGYMTHNFFCYQQVSATGIIFVLMGIASGQQKMLINEKTTICG